MADRLSSKSGKAAPQLRVVGREQDQEESSLDALFSDGLRVLRRRYKLATVVFILFLVPALAYIVQKPSRYSATARLLVERGEEADSVLDQLRANGPGTDDFQTQVKILRSRPIIAKAVVKAKLWESPEYKITETPPSITETWVLNSGLVEAFLDRLAVIPETGTHILNVTFTGTEPSVAMNATNGLVQVYIDEQSSAQLSASAEVVDWLNLRLTEQKQRLDESEAALQAYMEAQKSVSLQDRQNIVVQKLADLNEALTRAKTERMVKQTLYEQVKAAASAPDSLPIVLSNAVLQQLRAQVADLKQKELALAQDLGDKHPNLIKLRSELDLTESRLKAEVNKVIDSVKSDYDLAVLNEQGLSTALEEQKRDVMNLSRQSVEYNALQRQATSDRQLYERLLGETQTRGIAGKTVERKIRIIEAAELPRYPVSPNRRREMLLAGLCAILLGLSAPLVREALDHRVKTAADLEKRLGIRCLTMVPMAEKGDTSPEGSGPLFGHQATAFNEAFRRLRTAVALATPHAAPTRVLVTSALPHEGKSLVAANLAIALAQMKQRVLLIDGDLRRPKIHRMLGLKPFPGLADLLTSSVTEDLAVQPGTVPYLSVLTCGMKHVTTSELLASGNVERVLEQLAKSFDFVVFDSPPTGPVADACMIGQFVDFAVFVTKADATPVTAARLALEQLEAAGVTIAGAVLNGVNLKHAGYYSAYYAGGYSDYYSASPTANAKKHRSTEEKHHAASV